MPIKNAKEPMPSPMPGSSTSPELILEQLHRILAHPEFHGTPHQEQFLRFVVLETLEGRQGTIKGYTVATQVFGRQVDFDPKIVRVAFPLKRVRSSHTLTAKLELDGGVQEITTLNNVASVTVDTSETR